jgi:hypothetical protein
MWSGASASRLLDPCALMRRKELGKTRRCLVQGQAGEVVGDRRSLLELPSNIRIDAHNRQRRINAASAAQC